MNWWNTIILKQSPFSESYFELRDASVSSRTRHKLRARLVLAAGVVSGSLLTLHSTSSIHLFLFFATVFTLVRAITVSAFDRCYRFPRALSCPPPSSPYLVTRVFFKTLALRYIFALFKKIFQWFPVTCWRNPQILLFPTRPYHMWLLPLPPLHLPTSFSLGLECSLPHCPFLWLIPFWILPIMTFHALSSQFSPSVSYYPASFSP